ncbi:uncharacterized protein RHO25_012665 [Cercospora beticola]|uniref:Uncharacterized protein n=1 Tax=Cercospora beticola TaxID=122368 RepID=A0ABZ0P8K2_CERBT|nr:hypothetical protein RHO25_012665 [Cercospora beticola]CAK1368143.1 unnamed protein product [Cercospora beticola]
MKWTRVLTLAAAASHASAGYIFKKKIWSGQAERANSTALLQCVDQVRAELEESPTRNRIRGFRCADRWWQCGNFDAQYKSVIETSMGGFQRCEDDLYQAVYLAKDWFMCKIIKVGITIDRHVAYSPLGYEACPDRHVPCNPETSMSYEK